MELRELRERIDAVDRQLIDLLERRMDISAEIAAWKRAAGTPVLDAGREAVKLSAVRAACRPATAEGIAAVFESILAASRAYQTALLEEENAHGG